VLAVGIIEGVEDRQRHFRITQIFSRGFPLPKSIAHPEVQQVIALYLFVWHDCTGREERGKGDKRIGKGIGGCSNMVVQDFTGERAPVHTEPGIDFVMGKSSPAEALKGLAPVLVRIVRKSREPRCGEPFHTYLSPLEVGEPAIDRLRWLAWNSGGITKLDQVGDVVVERRQASP
jgi:hypothetical protein